MQACRLFIVCPLVQLACLACTSAPELPAAATPEPPAAGQVVLVFDSPPINHTYKLVEREWLSNQGFNNGEGCEISYVDDNHIRRNLPLNYEAGGDTLVIENTRNWLEVQHAYRGMDNYSYLLRNGDSVRFTYRGLEPKATVLNRTTKPYDTHLEPLKRTVHQDTIPAQVKYYAIFKLKRYNAQTILSELPQDLDSIRAIAWQEHRAEDRLLDSLYKATAISEPVYNHYKAKSRYDAEKLVAMVAREDLRRPGDILTTADMQRLFLKSTDTLAYSVFYHDFLGKVVPNYYHARVKAIPNKHGSNIDYRKVYDSVATSDFLPDVTKKILYLNYTQDIIKSVSSAEIEAHLDRFAVDVPDTVYQNYVINKYNLLFTDKGDLHLTALYDEETTFRQLMDQLQGKVVYVDFWASWCNPCLREMPASHQLQQAYQDKEVVFIYLSKDENAEKWRQATAKHDITQHSYLIDNQYTAELLDELNITAIPRYLVYNRRGDLVHQNAPRPGSPEIRKVLDKYLAE